MHSGKAVHVVSCHAEGEVGDVIIGLRFDCRIEEVATLGGCSAIVP